MASKGKSYQAPTATTIEIEASVLLSLIRHTSENYPALYSGALLGFEDDEGSVDVTHAYPFPYPDQYEGGSLRSKSGAQYQQDILSSLRTLGYGIDFQGWFQSTVSGNFVTTQLVDALVQQQLTNKNAFILVHNMASIGKELDLKALRLSESFVNTYLSGKWRSKDLQSNRLSYLNIFDEIEVTIHNQQLVSLYLAGESGDESVNSSEFDILNLSSNQNATAQLLESLYSQVDSYNYDQNNFNYYQRQLQKENSKITQWKQQRKVDNLERAKRGEEELDTQEWETIFRLPGEPSRYNNMLHSHAIDVLADDILKKCDEELTKSFAIERKLVNE
ncbi:eukaryotic translation initiation factor 3 subunit H [[Candida] anglica]|uniref:Eukaryotic translation initiation factor 3 subunit H n=1 Tax=[Candida] anglica TaxID=148631 RepID=A0ABP0EDJ1_9ASCO